MNLFKFLFCVLVFGTLGFGIVWLHIDQVQAGYRIQRKEAQLRSYAEEIRSLEIRREIAVKVQVLRARAQQHRIELVDLVRVPEST